MFQAKQGIVELYIYKLNAKQTRSPGMKIKQKISAITDGDFL